MATKKPEATGARPALENKPAGDKSDEQEKRITNLEATIRRMQTHLKHWGYKDGKANWLLLVILAFVTTATAWAAEKEVVRWIAPQDMDAVITLAADEGDDADDELQIVMKADGTAAVSIGGADALVFGSYGAAGAGGTATESIGAVNKTTIAISTTLTATDGSAEGETVKLYTFPAGRIYILGSAIDATIVNTATAANTSDVFLVGIGSAAANDDADLSDSGETDIITGPTLEDGAVTLTNQWEADMTCGADSVFGTATTASLNLNMGIADACITTNNFSATVTGTMSVFWINLGDD